MTGSGGIVEIQGTAEGAPFSEAEFRTLFHLARAREGHRQAGRPAENGGDVGAASPGPRGAWPGPDASGGCPDGASRLSVRRARARPPRGTTVRMQRTNRIMHRQITGKLVIATHNPGKLTEDARPARPLWHRGGIGRRDGRWPSRRKPRRPSMATRGSRLEASYEGDRTSASRTTREAGGRSALIGLLASIRPAGLVRSRDFGRRAREGGWSHPAGRAALGPPRTSAGAHFVSAALAPPGRTVTSRLSRAGSTGLRVWPRRAGPNGFGYDAMFLLRRPWARTFGEMTRGEEARAAAEG